MKFYLAMIYRSLRGQPKRAVLTLLSIFLGVVLISAAGALAASLQQTQLNQAIAITGEFHGTFNHLAPDQLDSLREDSDVQRVGSSAPLGSFVQDGLNMTIEGFDATALDLFNYQLQAGRFPEQEGEIALEAWAAENIAPGLSVGDTFHLTYFLYGTTDDGRTVTTGQVEGDFTLVGILDDITAAKLTGISLGLVSQSTVQALLPDEAIQYTAFVELGTSPAAIRPTLQRLAAGLGLAKDWTSVNETYVKALEAGSSATRPVLLLGALILIASVATIYNIFQISVVERMRQFGMLRSIGATPAQITGLVIGEALLLCLVGIPLGLAAGVGAAALLARTLALLESVIAVLVVPAWVLAASALTGLLAAVISALLPALWAARISPVAAVRCVDARGTPGTKQLSKKRQVSRGNGRSPHRFLPRMAYDNLWRSRGRSLVTIFSLGLGIVLTILFGAYAAGMNTDSVVQQFMKGSYAVKTTNPIAANGYSEAAAQAIASLPGVDHVIETRLDDLNYSLLPAGALDEAHRQSLEAAAQRNGSPAGVQEAGYLAVPSQVFGYDLETLASLSNSVLEGSLDPEQLANGEYAVVVDPQGVFGLHPGDELTLKKVVREGDENRIQAQTFTVAAVVSGAPVYMGYGLLGPKILLTDEAFMAYTGSDLYKRFDITVEAGADLQMLENRLEAIAGSVAGGALMSYEDMRQDLEKEKRDLLMMVYGLVGVVTVIGIVNIINTLTTNLILRTREFGALRAIGMTETQLKTVTRLEGLYYGLFSTAWGVACGSLLASILLKMMAEQGPMEWAFPWGVVLLAALVGPAISVTATLLPARRISSLTIMDALRMVE